MKEKKRIDSDYTEGSYGIPGEDAETQPPGKTYPYLPYFPPGPSNANPREPTSSSPVSQNPIAWLLGFGIIQKLLGLLSERWKKKNLIKEARRKRDQQRVLDGPTYTPRDLVKAKAILKERESDYLLKWQPDQSASSQTKKFETETNGPPVENQGFQTETNGPRVENPGLEPKIKNNDFVNGPLIETLTGVGSFKTSTLGPLETQRKAPRRPDRQLVRPKGVSLRELQDSVPLVIQALRTRLDLNGSAVIYYRGGKMPTLGTALYSLYGDYLGLNGGVITGKTEPVSQTLLDRWNQENREREKMIGLFRDGIIERLVVMGLTPDQIEQTWHNWWVEVVLLRFVSTIPRPELEAVEKYRICERILFGTIFGYTIQEWLTAKGSQFQLSGAINFNKSSASPSELVRLLDRNDTFATELINHPGAPEIITMEDYLSYHAKLVNVVPGLWRGRDLRGNRTRKLQEFMNSFPHLRLDPPRKSAWVTSS